MGVTAVLKAIRSNCLDCRGNSGIEVEKCVIPDCPLFPYRLGKDVTAKKTIKKSKPKTKKKY